MPPRPPLSPLAAALRDTIQQIGTSTGLDAWEDIARRIELSRRLARRIGPQAAEMAPDLGDVKTYEDRYGRVRISRADLEAALVECEAAGGLRCDSASSSDPLNKFEWRPLPAEPTADRPRQRTLLFEE